MGMGKDFPKRWRLLAHRCPHLLPTQTWPGIWQNTDQLQLYTSFCASIAHGSPNVFAAHLQAFAQGAGSLKGLLVRKFNGSIA